MRIVCQKCSAAYAIDDKFVTPKGVRAQCPRCRHLQLVKKDDAAAAPAPAPAPAAAAPALPPNPFADAGSSDLFDLSSPASATSPGMPSPAGGDGRELMDFSELGLPGGAPPGAPAAGPGARPPAGGGGFGAPAPFAAPPSPFGAVDFGSPHSPFGPPGGGSSAPPQLAPAPAPALGGGAMPFSSAAPQKADANPFGSFGDNNLFGQSGSQESLAPLGSQGRPPAGPGASPFGAPAPAGSAGSPFGAPAGSDAAAAPPEVKCKSCGKPIFDPFDQALEICDDCRNKPPAPGPSSNASAATVTSAAPAARPPPSRSGVLAPPEPYRSMVAGANQRSKAPIFIALGVLVAAGGGYLAYKQVTRKKPPPLAKKVDTPSAPIEQMVGEWRLRYPELTGTAAEYVEQGDEQMARDTTQGYLRAEEAYQRALVLDSRNDRAVAGWVLALAFGRFGQIDERTGAAAEKMIDSAGKRSGDPRAFAAHAHLLLARGGNFNDIKVLAESALKSASDKDRALGHLALGQAFLGKNPLFASEHFEKAAAADPKLKRAVLYQAQLLVQQGELKKAMESIDKKLGADPDQWEAADMLARLYVEAGEPAKARKAYLQVPSAAKDPRAQMTLAILQYQHEGQAAGAVKTLEAVLALEEQLDPMDVVSVLGHLAAAKRVAGDLEGAAGAATRALDKRPGDPNALAQRFLISVERGKAADARGQLQPLLGRLNDPALELLFQGLVELIDGRHAEAQRLLVQSWEKDSRRTDALMLAGAAAAKGKVAGKAWEYALKHGLKADPWRAAPLAVMAPIFVRPQDVLKPARGAFEALAEADEDPNPPLAEGLLAWFSDDLDAAAKQFDRVIHIDPDNGAGSAYRAFVALKKGQAAAAEKIAGKGVRGDRTGALPHLALGLSLLAQNKLEPAKKALAKASELAPAMLLPRAKLGEINGRQKRPEEARKLLTTVLLNDPLYREARRAQYLGGS